MSKLIIVENRVKETEILQIDDEVFPLDLSTPEKNLCVAVLLGAVEDLKRKGEPARAAKRFFLSRDSSYVFSFNAICIQLEIDPSRILRKVGLF